MHRGGTCSFLAFVKLTLKSRLGQNQRIFQNMILDGLSTLDQYPSPPCNRIFEVAIACVGIDAFIDTRIAFALTGQVFFFICWHTGKYYTVIQRYGQHSRSGALGLSLGAYVGAIVCSPQTDNCVACFCIFMPRIYCVYCIRVF